jgi:hypothetical protein
VWNVLSNDALLNSFSTRKWDKMKSFIAAALVISSIALAPMTAAAGERFNDALMGGASGAVVAGPVGLVAGGVIGYVAGPSIGHGLRHHHYYRHHNYH